MRKTYVIALEFHGLYKEERGDERPFYTMNLKEATKYKSLKAVREAVEEMQNKKDMPPYAYAIFELPEAMKLLGHQ